MGIIRRGSMGTGTSHTIYSNCKTTAQKTITSYTPMKVGWCLWEN
ncbi:hypothetical protein [Streptomyces sp. NPDC013181]